MQENERKRALWDMLYLTSCGVNGIVPDRQRIEKMTLENVYNVSRMHFLNAITYYALESAHLPENEVLKKWRESRDKAIRKNMMLNAGRAQITEFLESIGCWYMPLKGVYLQEMYPKPGMRQMSDNDILFDEKYRREVKKWFIDNGYKLEKEHVKNHDAYLKAPVLNYEMHLSLYSKNFVRIPEFYAYYSDVTEKLIKDDDSEYGRHFSDEDFYIYITTHSFKHYQGYGTGLRSLLDQYVFLKGKALDNQYIEREMCKLGIAEYEKLSRDLCIKIFDDPDKFNAELLPPEEQEMLNVHLISGTYGNFDLFVSRGIEENKEKSGKKSKLQYILRRIFPDKEHLKKYYPFYYKHKFFLPFLWIYRIINSLLKRRKKVVSELKALKKMALQA